MDNHMFYCIGDFARQILSMERKINDLTVENERLAGFEKKYNDLMSDSLSHSHAMIGNTIKMLLVPGIAEAFQKNAKTESFIGDSTVTGDATIADIMVNEDVPVSVDQLLSSKELLIKTGQDDEPVLSANEKEMYEEVRFDLEVKKNPDLLL
jgi:hypothetical protein